MDEVKKRILVTVKLPRNPNHDPHNKKSGPCPVSGLPCTDVTGQHHTYLAEGSSIDAIVNEAKRKWVHITRLEEFEKFEI